MAEPERTSTTVAAEWLRRYGPGKLAADVAFYLPVILTHEMRQHARRHARP